MVCTKGLTQKSGKKELKQNLIVEYFMLDFLNNLNFLFTQLFGKGGGRGGGGRCKHNLSKRDENKRVLNIVRKKRFGVYFLMIQKLHKRICLKFALS